VRIVVAIAAGILVAPLHWYTALRLSHYLGDHFDGRFASDLLASVVWTWPTITLGISGTVPLTSPIWFASTLFLNCVIYAAVALLLQRFRRSQKAYLFCWLSVVLVIAVNAYRVQALSVFGAFIVIVLALTSAYLDLSKQGNWGNSGSATKT
jgi:hypothetical protein